MPATRREFLKQGAAGLSFLSLGGAVPGMFAAAAEESAAAAKNDHVLVVVELSGGNDGLNTLIPFENELYYKNRRLLGISKENVRKIDDHVGMHPALEPLERMYQEGRLAWIQGVGYPEPDRSHFRSMEIWHTASTSPRPPETGWLGNLLDGLPPAQRDPVLGGLALTGALPQALEAGKTVVPVVSQLDAFADSEQAQQPGAQLRRKLSTAEGNTAGPVDFLRRQMTTVYRTAERLHTAASNYQPSTEYPGTRVGEELKRAAQIIAGNLGVRVLYVSQDGYDTHANQSDAHANLLGDLAASLSAFETDVTAHGWGDRVTVLMFSEFGRRVDENASAGTDHGAASCLFVFGPSVRGGLYGSYPSLEKLGDGDLVYTTDFRNVYASVLDQWMGCPSEKVLGKKFDALPLFGKKS